jgi:hypothetical protein
MERRGKTERGSGRHSSKAGSYMDYHCKMPYNFEKPIVFDPVQEMLRCPENKEDSGCPTHLPPLEEEIN